MPLISYADVEKKAHPYTLLADDPIIVKPLGLCTQSYFIPETRE